MTALALPALLCPALPCLALLCLALPCLPLLCPALPCHPITCPRNDAENTRAPSVPAATSGHPAHARQAPKQQRRGHQGTLSGGRDRWGPGSCKASAHASYSRAPTDLDRRIMQSHSLGHCWCQVCPQALPGCAMAQLFAPNRPTLLRENTSRKEELRATPPHPGLPALLSNLVEKGWTPREGSMRPFGHERSFRACPRKAPSGGNPPCPREFFTPNWN